MMRRMSLGSRSSNLVHIQVSDSQIQPNQVRTNIRRVMRNFHRLRRRIDPVVCAYVHYGLYEMEVKVCVCEGVRVRVYVAVAHIQEVKCLHRPTAV